MIDTPSTFLRATVQGCVLAIALSGCGTPAPNIRSVECGTPESRVRNRPKTAAVLPVVALAANEKVAADLRKAVNSIALFQEGDGFLVVPAKVEQIMASEPELRSAYERLASRMLVLPKPLMARKGDRPLRVYRRAWDPRKARGLRYDRLATLDEDDDTMTVKKGKLEWQITVHSETLPSTSERRAVAELAGALKCDALVVPVLVDHYTQVRDFLVLNFLIPLGYARYVTLKTDVVLYLIDGKTGSIIRAIRTVEPGTVACAASLQRVLGRGSAIGTIELTKRRAPANHLPPPLSPR